MAAPQQIVAWFEKWVEAGRPRQAQVEWQRELWMERYPNVADQFGALPPLLDRETVRRLVLEYPHDVEGAFCGLVAVLTWGWSQTRRGLTIAKPLLVEGLHQWARISLRSEPSSTPAGRPRDTRR